MEIADIYKIMRRTVYSKTMIFKTKQTSSCSNDVAISFYKCHCHCSPRTTWTSPPNLSPFLLSVRKIIFWHTMSFDIPWHSRPKGFQWSEVTFTFQFQVPWELVSCIYLYICLFCYEATESKPETSCVHGESGFWGNLILTCWNSCVFGCGTLHQISVLCNKRGNTYYCFMDKSLTELIIMFCWGKLRMSCFFLYAKFSIFPSHSPISYFIFSISNAPRCTWQQGSA